jgi:hypothetical protein
MGKFNKTLLQSYILTNCKRRLFLELGRDSPDVWFDPVRPIPSTPPERLIFQTKYLKEKGKEYEQIVYSYLKNLKNVEFKPSKDESGNEIIGRVKLSVKILNEIADKFVGENAPSLCLLLEHQFKIPKSFFYEIFYPKAKYNDVPVNYSSQRPDLIFLGNGLNKYMDKIYEINAGGNIQLISKEKENARIGISVFDIKYTNEENVGKKHFLEIFYYLRTLAYFLKELGLDKTFYVRANYNGILPLRKKDKYKLLNSIYDLFDNGLVSFISWKESQRIYTSVVGVIRELWKKAPCQISQVKTNIHDGCGYCQFIEDCKETLGMKDKEHPENWAIDLIPFTSKSIAQQLKNELNIQNIGDLLKKINQIKVGAIPKPLYSELPTMKLKTRAIKNKRIIYPKNHQTYSYSIPRYSPISINFDVEYDRNTDRIFAVGILLKMFIPSKLKYHGIFDNWWRIWKNALEGEKTSEEIQKELNDYLVREISLVHIALFLNCLKNLEKIEISLKGEKTLAGTSIMYRFASVNKDITAESEAILTIKTILKLNWILQMCNIIEDYIVIDITGKYGTYYIGPDTGIFYWSRNQLEHLQDMIQRNLNKVISEPLVRGAYEEILMYFTPSDTEVSNPYQHKKLFDIQSFAESCLGFPDIINYTWHGIAKKLFKNLEINTKMYWIPHFNYLDLSSWLLYLREIDPNKKKKKMNIIKHQIIFKLHIIDSIRAQFQKEGNLAISENARTISRHDYKSAILPSEFHDIAHVWYLFSRLDTALQQQDDEYYRTMFPDFSIGKLFSARVSDLNMVDLQGKSLQYTFFLTGLSSNMKLKEGDRVLLIPNSKRGLKLDKRVYKWIIDIETIEWNSKIKGHYITTKPSTNNVFDACEEESIEFNAETWYIYHFSSDAWSNKLYNNNHSALLQRHNFGRSWLGERLAFLWDIRNKPKLKWPEHWNFSTPSIYLFAPKVLRYYDKALSNQTIYSQINPTPDISQKEAIINSLSNPISAILGPPGTVKSQTIAALIDEFIIRRTRKNKDSKILITSFSYTALRVIIDKIRKSKDHSGNPTPSSEVQKIFFHSRTQNPIPNERYLRNVDDLMKDGQTWKLNGKTRTVTETILLEESLEDNFIIFANAHQLYHLTSRVSENFCFDLICVDEASQLPADYFMSSLQFIKKPKISIKKPELMVPKQFIRTKNEVKNLMVQNSAITSDSLTKVIVVGDHNQLPPVRVKKPPKNLETILDNIFRYYVEGHNISKRQLKVNYRSHRDIVEFTSQLGLYENIIAYKKNANRILRGNLEKIKKSWVREVLEPQRVACAIIHQQKFEIGISLLEAQIVAEIIKGFYLMVNPKNETEEKRFWNEKVGVVAPHNAQGRTVIRNIFQLFEIITTLPKSQLMQHLKESVYSVEKFQGSDRDLIICSIGLSDEDKLQMEDEFIYNLNRFNVLTSRAKSKLIFVSSDKFVEYIPDEREILEESSKIYRFVKEYCKNEIMLNIESEEDEKFYKVRFRYK